MKMNEHILKFCEFCRKEYSRIILATLIIAVISGFFTSHIGILLKPLTIPLIMIMIVSMGFTMTLKSFAFAFKEVKGFSFGMAFNFVLAPLLCFALSLLVQNPEIATGLILIGAVPCAGMAIVWAGLLEGDVPLAVLINVGTMIAAPFLIPFIMLIFAGSYLEINTFDMLLTLIYTVLIPIIAGIFLREVFEKRKRDVKKWQPVCPAISSICAVFLMFIAVNTSMPIVLKNLSLLPSLIYSVLLIFPILFGVAYVISNKFFNRAKNIAITYSSGMKNLPIALGIAMVSFGSLTTLSVAMGFAFQMLTAVLFYRLFVSGKDDVNESGCVKNN